MDADDRKLFERSFPEGTKLPRELVEVFDEAEGRIGLVAGDFMIQSVLYSEAKDWFSGNEQAVARFCAFGRDGDESLYGYWLHEGATLETAPIGYLPAKKKKLPARVLASSLPDFLSLLAIGVERIGDVAGWRNWKPADCAFLDEHRRWLKKKKLSAPKDPRAFVDEARARHPDLQAWVQSLGKKGAKKPVKAAAPKKVAAKATSPSKDGFPSLLADFGEVAVESGADVEVYSTFNQAYKPSDWTRDPTSDEEFATFAQNGVGSQYALWLGASKDALRAPVVLFGRDGEAAVLAEDLHGFFALFAAGVDPSLAIADGEAKGEPNAALGAWLKKGASGKKPGTPAQILARAAKAHPTFAVDVRAKQAAARSAKKSTKRR
jgi:hypothetical protein